MAFDYSKDNITDNNATGDTDGNVGSPTSVSTQDRRSLDQATQVVQFQSGSTTYSGRFKNLSNLDLSSGVFIGHVGHNSPYRTFTLGFARWRFFSGGSTTTNYVEFDTFSIATVGDDPRTIAHVIDLNATPSRSSGTFDNTDVTRVQYSEARNTASSNTTLIFISFWTHAPSDNSANTPKIHGTTSIEDFVRELRNDNFGSGLGGPTGNGQLTDAVRNTSALLSFNMPVAFGKTGVVTVIDGTGIDYQIGVDSTLYHLTGQGILWTNNWDTSVAGQSLDLTGTTINMLTPSDWTVFDVDSANVVITLTGTTITNAGDIRLGTSCTGAPSAITMGTSKTLTVANSIDNYNVTGTLRYEGSSGTITGVTATRLVLEQAGSYTFTDCTITEVENVSGGVITITTDTSLTTIETSGTINVIDSFLSFSGIDSWIVYANATDQDANTNPLGSGTGAENFRFTYVASTTYYLRLVTGTDTILKTVTPTQAGETAVELTTAGLLTALPANVDAAVTSSVDGIDLPATIASGVESAILDDSDGQAVITAIVNAIGNTNVDEVALVAAIRSDMERSGGSLDNILADTNELQTNQGNWLTATSVDLNNNAITSSVVATNALNNSSFTTGFYNSINAEVDTALSDYDAPTKAELDTVEANIINAIPDVSGLSTFNPAIDVVANVTLVDTVTTNTDMRGTDSANTVAPDNASIAAILVDTNELQSNQGDWLTADLSSLETKAQADTRQTALIAEHDTTQTAIAGIANYDDTVLISKVDVIDTNVDAIKAKTDTLVNTDLTGIALTTDVTTSQTAVQADIAGLNDLSSADVTAAVPSTAQIEAALLNEGDGQQLIDVIVQAIGNQNIDEALLIAAIRSDLERAGGLLDNLPTLTEIEASTVLAKTSDVAGLNDITASDVWAVATRTVTGGTIDTNNDMRGTDGANTVAPDNAGIANNGTAIAGLNDVTASEVVTAMQVVADDFKADTAGLSTLTQTELDALETNLTAEHDATQVAIGNIANYDDTVLISKVDALETKAQADTRQTALIAEHDATQVTLADLDVNVDLTGVALTSDVTSARDVVRADISDLNDVTASEVVTAMQAVAGDFKADTAGLSTLTASQVNAEVDTALADYDAPTKAELDATQTAIIDAVPTSQENREEMDDNSNKLGTILGLSA